MKTAFSHLPVPTRYTDAPKSCALASQWVGGRRDHFPGVPFLFILFKVPSSHLPGAVLFRFVVRGPSDHHFDPPISHRVFVTSFFQKLMQIAFI